MIDPDEKASAAAGEDDTPREAEEREAEEREAEETKAEGEREDPFALDPLGPPGGRPW